MKIGDIWGATEDKPEHDPLNAPTAHLGSAREEIVYHLTVAQTFIRQYIGAGTQTLEQLACHILDITESELRLVMQPSSYDYSRGIDLVRVTNIGRRAFICHMGYDVTKFLYSQKAVDVESFGLTQVIFDRLFNRKYDKFTVNQMKEIWEKIPDTFQTA